MVLPLAVASLTLAAFFLVSLRRPWLGAAAVVILLPWDGLAVDPGLRLTGYRLALFGWVGAIMVYGVATKTSEFPKDSAPRLSIWGVAFLAYAVLWTLFQLFLVPETNVMGAASRAVLEVRSVTQVVWLVLRFSPLLLLPVVLSCREEAAALVRVFLISLTILTTVGWIQVGLWWTSGIDIAPIGAVERFLGGEIAVRHGILPVFDQQVLRMSSFGGEPKGLGQSLAVGLLIVQGLLWMRSLGRQKLVALWAFLFLAMLATFSTSALYVWVGGTFVMAAYLILSRSRGRVRIFLFTLGLFALCGMTLGAGIMALGLEPAAVGEVLEARTLGRRIIPDFDLAVLGFLRDKPGWGLVGVGLGNVHAYAAPFIPDFARHYMEGNIFVAKSGYLRLLSEVGLIGLLLFSVWMWREISLFGKCPVVSWSSRLDAGSDVPDPAAFRSLAMGLGLVMVLAFMARGYLWNEAVWSVGILRAMRRGT